MTIVSVLDWCDGSAAEEDGDGKILVVASAAAAFAGLGLWIPRER